MSGGDYSINELLDQGRRIWGWRRMRLDEIVPAMGVVFGDICRWSGIAMSIGKPRRWKWPL